MARETLMPIVKKAFEHVAMVLCDPRHDHRRTLRTALVAEGFRSIKDISELEVMRDITEKTVPDLIVIDLDLPDGSTSEFINDVRSGNLGMNPFIPIIAVNWDANMESVKPAVDAGVDDLLAAPLSVKALLGRIEGLVKNRKPFVVTSDYIGPDRRRGGRHEASSEIPLFHVPNTLRDKAAGRRVDMTELQTAINSVMFEINEQRLVRNSYQISFLVNLIVKAIKEGAVNREVEEHIRRLAEIANECGLRLKDSSFEHVGELCHTLIEVTTSISHDPQSPNSRDVQLLPKLSQAILAGFNPARDESVMAGEISEMVGKFAERANADALRRAAERSQLMIDAQRAEGEQSKEREAKTAAERMARQEALPVDVKVSNQPKDMQEWQERRARARKRDIRSSSNK